MCEKKEQEKQNVEIFRNIWKAQRVNNSQISGSSRNKFPLQGLLSNNGCYEKRDSDKIAELHAIYTENSRDSAFMSNLSCGASFSGM